MYKNKRIVLLFLILFSTTGLWAQNHSIAVFPYYSPDGISSEQYGFLDYTISDTIHQELLNENLLYIFERNQIENEMRVLGFDQMEIRELDNRIALCRELGCDYLIWGYYIIEQDNLIVFNHLVETSSGRTLKIEKKEFPTGPQIFSEVEQFTKEFTGWINRELPEREIAQEVVIVQETVIVNEEDPLLVELGVGAFYNIIASPYFSGSLKNGIGGVLDINFYHEKTGIFYFGLSVPITMLQTINEEVTNINVLMATILLRAGIDWELTDFMHLQFSAKAGAAFLFGYKDYESISFIRPALGPEINFSFFPLYLINKNHPNPQLISLQLGTSYLFVYNTYQGQHNHLLQPQLKVSFSF